MTPLIGLIIAIVAAQLAPNVRALLTAVLALMLAATAVQSWDLGAGLGSNPSSTIGEASYWVVQVIIISVMLALAYGFFVLRARRAKRHGRSLERPAFSGRRGVIATALLGTVMTVVGVVGCLIASAARTHNGTGSGNIPWTGVAGISIGLVLLTVLSVALLRDRRSAAANAS
jgi:hypothetical protein